MIDADARARALMAGIKTNRFPVTSGDAGLQSDGRGIRPRPLCDIIGSKEWVDTIVHQDVHGRGGTAYGWRALRNGWLEKAEEEGFIVVWPQGTQDFRDPSVYSSSTDMGFDPRPSFNSGGVSTMNTNINRFEEDITKRGCCNPAITLGTDDVGFLRKMVEDVTAEYGIDKSRVYWTGISNGCSMSQTMAAVLSILTNKA